MQNDTIYFVFTCEVLYFNENISLLLIFFHLLIILFVSAVAIDLIPVHTTVLRNIFVSFDLYAIISTILLFRMKYSSLFNYRKSIVTILVINSMFVLFAFSLLILHFAHKYAITSIFI